MTRSQYQGWAFTLDATPSTYDLRSQLWVFGLCVHTLRTGQLHRLGAITGIPSNPQTKTRALVAGLAALAKHTSTAVKVIVQVVAVWEAWTYQDLYEGLTAEDFQRVTVLYVSKNTRTPDTPGSEPHLQRRQRDAALAAWEPPNSLHDKKATEWQEVLDTDHAENHKHAAARLAKIYADKEHYLHQKAPRHQGRQTKQHKKQLVQHCRKPWQAPFHRWQPHRSGYQCSACGERIHQALTAATIEDRLAQICPQLQIEENYPEHHSPHKPIQKKITCWKSRTTNSQIASTPLRKPKGISGVQIVATVCTRELMKKHSKASASTGCTTSHTPVMLATFCGSEEIVCTAKTVELKRRQMPRTGQSSRMLRMPCRKVAREQPSVAHHQSPRSSEGRRLRPVNLKTANQQQAHQHQPTNLLQKMPSSRKAMKPSHTWSVRHRAVRQASRHPWCPNSSHTVKPLLPPRLPLSQSTRCPGI